MKRKFTIDDVCIPPSSSLKNSWEVIDTVASQFVLVVDNDKTLLGVITDGDIRRSLLKGNSLDMPVSSIMNKSPKVTKRGESQFSMVRRMKGLDIHFLIEVDEKNHVTDIVRFSDIVIPDDRTTPVVIMAGGRGRRLGPLTDNCPKPMLPLGKKPILEMIIEDLMEYGFLNFYISVNYLKDTIVDYFGNGAKKGVKITYLQEDQPLDTAGALSLIDPLPDEPLLVMNGDIYTDLDFGNLLETHKKSVADATICLREVSYQVPFGVVDLSGDGTVHSIREKPVTKYMANAGMYVLNPEILSMLPKGEPYLMTTLMDDIISRGKKLASHTVDGLWIDVGRMEDFERARRSVCNNP